MSIYAATIIQLLKIETLNKKYKYLSVILLDNLISQFYDRVKIYYLQEVDIIVITISIYNIVPFKFLTIPKLSVIIKN